MAIEAQDKQKEIAFFDAHAEKDDYNVFSDATNRKIVNSCIDCAGIEPGSHIADLGCGSGVFTSLLSNLGYQVCGLDISLRLLQTGKKSCPEARLIAGDVEHLPFPTDSLDAILLSGIIHHFPVPSALAAEVFRVLKPGGRFAAFDPNRRNPFMYLYRDRSSPFYSSKGVTENERPIAAEETAALFGATGFAISINYISGLEYRFVASSLMTRLLPIYNFVDRIVFAIPLLKRYRAFVITTGEKP